MRFLSWLKRSREGVLASGWRLTLFVAFNLAFNRFFYPWAMSPLGFGIVMGWLVMSTASLILCAFIFWRHDRGGVDWLFAKAAREWEEGTVESSGWKRRMLVRISKSRNRGFVGFATFILASINVDPVIVAVHYQKSHFKGISLQEWGVLFASVVVANLWFGFETGMLVTLVRWVLSIF
jgi:hypothetical protein